MRIKNYRVDLKPDEISTEPPEAFKARRVIYMMFQYSETDAEPNVKVRFRPLFFRGKLRASPQPAVQSDKAKDESSEVSQYMSEQDGKIFELHPSMVLSSYYQNVIDCHSASAIKPPLFRKVRIATSGRETRRTTQSCLI